MGAGLWSLALDGIRSMEYGVPHTEPRGESVLELWWLLAKSQESAWGKLMQLAVRRGLDWVSQDCSLFSSRRAPTVPCFAPSSVSAYDWSIHMDVISVYLNLTPCNWCGRCSHVIHWFHWFALSWLCLSDKRSGYYLLQSRPRTLHNLAIVEHVSRWACQSGQWKD